MTRPKCEEHVAPLSNAPSARATRCLQGIMDVAHKQNPIELRGFGRGTGSVKCPDTHSRAIFLDVTAGESHAPPQQDIFIARGRP